MLTWSFFPGSCWEYFVRIHPALGWNGTNNGSAKKDMCMTGCIATVLGWIGTDVAFQKTEKCN